MAAGGLPEPLDGHASRIVELGLAMIDEAARHGGALGPINLRIGVHSGVAVGGVIGKRKIAFDVWGDTVNVASRLEEQGVAGRIQISEATRQPPRRGVRVGVARRDRPEGARVHGDLPDRRRETHDDRRRRFAGVAQRDRRIAVDSLAPMNPSRLLAPVRDVLGNGPMARVQAAWLLSIAAEWAYLVALLVFAYGVGGVAAAGLIATLRMLPPVIGAPLATTLADRFPTAAVLAGVNAMRALVVLSTAAVLVLGGPPVLVFAAAMVEGLFAVVKRPATLSLLPGLARTPEELVAGNAVMSSGEALGMLVGPAAASLVLGLGGLEVALAVPAIALLAAAALTVTLRAAAHRPGVRGGTLRELAGGFRALRQHSTAGLIVALFAAQTFVRGLLTVLLVAASVELLGFGEGGVGWLNSAIGAGGLIGAAGATLWMVGGRLGPAFTPRSRRVGAADRRPRHRAGRMVGHRTAGHRRHRQRSARRRGPHADPALRAERAARPSLRLLRGHRRADVRTRIARRRPARRRSSGSAWRSWRPARSFRWPLWSARPPSAGPIPPPIVPRRELDLLRGDPLFAPLSLVILEQLAQSMTLERAATGTAS